MGSGGKSLPENVVSLCALCHARAHDGHISRQMLEAVMTLRYGYRYGEGDK